MNREMNIKERGYIFFFFNEIANTKENLYQDEIALLARENARLLLPTSEKRSLNHVGLK